MQTNRSASRIQQYRTLLSRRFAGECACPLPGNIQQIVDDYLEYLESELSTDNAAINISQVQEMLQEVTCIIRSSGVEMEGEFYRHLLVRLNALYRNGLFHESRDAVALTSADYAEVIETISSLHPEFDYTEIIGHLISYMNRLYKLRKGNWLTVYQHLLGMPESIEAVRLLRVIYFGDVQRWTEEGVQNLFHIRRDLLQRIRELDSGAEALRLKIDKLRGRIADKREAAPARNVVYLQERILRRELEGLEADYRKALDERRGKESLVSLIDSNIDEFENRLAASRRAYFIRLINNTD